MTNFRDRPVLPSVTSVIAARTAAIEAGRPNEAPSVHDLITEKLRRDRLRRSVPLAGIGN